jgi:hypothetical protein
MEHNYLFGYSLAGVIKIVFAPKVLARQNFYSELCFRQKFRSAKLLPEIVFVVKIFCAQKTLATNGVRA